VAVDSDRVPAESPELTGQGGEIVLVHGRLRLAEPVDIDYGDEVAEIPAGRRGRRLPDLAFGALAVAHENEGARRDLSSFWREPSRRRSTALASDPVAALTQGIRGVGWPSRSLVIFLRSSKVSSG